MVLTDPPIAYDNSSPLERAYFQEGTYVVNADNLIQRPDVRKKLFPHLREEVDFVDFFIQSGRTEVAEQSHFHHYEEKPLVPLAQIKSKSGTPGNGNPVTITIESVNDDKINPFKYWDVWEIGGNEGWIEQASDITVNSGTGEHQVVFQADDDIDLVTSAVVGEFITWRHTAKADGTGQPPGMHSKPVKYTGRTQILATSYETDGSAAANVSDVVVTKSGKKYAYWRGVDQAYTRHKMAISYALGLGQGTNTVVDTQNENKVVRRTEGMDWKIRRLGLNEPGNLFDYQDFLKINEALENNNAPDEYVVCAGYGAYIMAEEIFFNQGLTSGVVQPKFEAFSGNDYTKWGSADPKQRALDLGYNSVNLFGRTYHFKKEKWLNYKQVTGAPNKPYKNTLYFLPMTQFTSRNPDSGSVETMDTFTVKYKMSDRENRYMEYTVKDWKTDDQGVDKFKFWHRSELGLRMAMLHWCARWYYDETASS